MRPALRPVRAWRRLIATLVAAAVLVSVAPVTGSADDLDDRRRAAQERADAAQQRSDDLQASVEGLSAELAQAVSDLAATEARLPAAQAELKAAQDELAGAERGAALVQARLTDAIEQQERITAQVAESATRGEEVRASVGQLARQAYQNGGEVSPLAVVLDAQDLDDFNRRYQAAAAAQRAQSEMVDELARLAGEARQAEARLVAVTDRIADLKVEADEEVAVADQARAAAATREQEIEQLITDQRASQQRLAGMKAQAEAEQAQAERERGALESELAGIIAEQRRQAEAAAAANQPAAPGPAAPPPPSSGSGAIFANPTSINPMYVTSNYGMRLHPILGYTRLHAGIDLRTYCNTPLYAPRDATVQWAQWRNGFGNQVMLNYGTVNGQPMMSSSNHMTRSVVSAGQQVRQGDLIGYSGNTGLSGACHLHFEVYVNGSTVDPAPLLGR
ncbi:metalloendopeptidase [Cellulomonas hominis]|uniref:Metalloendopeptidase n=1 Tax=Cellulomonas hominis TaxID=156981 RepID=A0A511FCI9_9CELL|nr:M23 family metallopeptidase [Cellulomonas hominis]MBB5472870.1 murein DD-endopeptidase MepM/ murein hydrolase activator NlpD [Cellulomonas hominis]NKY06253.1 peptidoglycan DD-metalloendopeptidase family protein [Cellulomonas hominis]GEL46965.1 metalloendopeptidase [Cellulomonas hominis]